MSIRRVIRLAPSLLAFAPWAAQANPVAHASAAGIALPALGTGGIMEVLAVGAALVAAALATRRFSRG
ncbi:MAG: hypothetical protein IT561_23705 [Alphaproteobacteria bacterium]|nr:hypothetical protein [Alphaproteobacteria bacterium]